MSVTNAERVAQLLAELDTLVLPINEYAAYSGHTTATVRQYAWDGRLASVRVPKSVIVDPNGVAR